MPTTATTPTPRKRADPMLTALTRIERRQDVSERDAKQHWDDNETDFKELRVLIGILSHKIDDMGADIERRVSTYNTERLEAKAYAAGFAKGTTPKEPNKWALAIVPVLMAAIMTGMGAWVAHDIWEGAPPHHEQTTVTTSATVERASPVGGR